MLGISVESLKEDQPVYVKNKTNSDFLLVLHSDRSSEVIPIPRTFIPFRITDFAEVKVLKSSPDFRKALAKGIIEIVPADEAEEELRQPEAQEELEKIKAKYFSFPEDLASSQQSVMPKTEGVPMIDLLTASNLDGISLIVRDTVVRSDIDDNEKIRILRTEYKSGRLTKNDFDFIIASTDDKSELHKWAKSIKARKSKKKKEKVKNE